SRLITEICVIGRQDKAGFRGSEILCGVVVPDFDVLKEQHIGNAGESIRWELENLGRELPEYQRVHDFVLRTGPLPRTATRKIRRFELKEQLESRAGEKREKEEIKLTEDDTSLMEAVAGKAIAAAIKQHAPKATAIHPGMNLEI